MERVYSSSPTQQRGEKTHLLSSSSRHDIQEFKRQWELGLSWQGQAESPETSSVMVSIIRGAVGEFLGTLLFLFSGVFSCH